VGGGGGRRPKGLSSYTSGDLGYLDNLRAGNGGFFVSHVRPSGFTVEPMVVLASTTALVAEMEENEDPSSEENNTDEREYDGKHEGDTTWSS